MAIGGGIDIPINNNFQFRPVEIDYPMTRFTNQFNNSSQNNFRDSAGFERCCALHPGATVRTAEI